MFKGRYIQEVLLIRSKQYCTSRILYIEVYTNSYKKHLPRDNVSVSDLSAQLNSIILIELPLFSWEIECTYRSFFSSDDSSAHSIQINIHSFHSACEKTTNRSVNGSYFGTSLSI